MRSSSQTLIVTAVLFTLMAGVAPIGSGAAVGQEAAAQDPQVLWSSWDPRVVDLATTESATLTVFVDVDPATIEVSLRSNGCVGSIEIELIPLLPVAERTYQATLTTSQILHNYVPGDMHSVVGCLKVSGSPRSNIVVNVRTSSMVDVAVQTPQPGVQVAPHILNLIGDEPLLGRHGSVDLLRRFYDFCDVDFDFVAVVDMVNSTNNRTYFARRNDTQGIGLGSFDFLAGTGVPERLQGTIIYPIDSFFDAAEGATIHEIGHRWMNWLDGPFSDPRGGVHWPISDLADGIMGFSNLARAGSTFPFDIIDNLDGTYLLERRERATEFNDVELYLMGLLPAEEVGEHIVFQDQDQLDQLRDGGVLVGPVDTVGVDDIIDLHGPRIPAFGDAPTEFRLGVIVLSKDRLLSPAEVAFFDHMSARAEATTELPFTSGLARGITKPFFLATGGRATLSTRCHIAAVDIAVDIKPDSEQNRVDLRNRGVIPVAILGTATFDVSDVDVSTLTFGPGGASPTHAAGGHIEDVNGDGIPDLVSHYRTQETGISPGNEQACVSGALLNGTRFEACDSVSAIP